MTDGQTAQLRWVTEGKGSVSERTSGPASLWGESCERGIKSENLWTSVESLLWLPLGIILYLN